MRATDRDLLDRIILAAEQCRRVVDLLEKTPPDCAMYTSQLRQLSEDLADLTRAIAQRLGALDPVAIEGAFGDVFDELTESPEFPEATDAGLLAAIRSASTTLDQHASLILRNDPPQHVFAIDLAVAFTTVALMSVVTGVRANPAPRGSGGDAA